MTDQAKFGIAITSSDKTDKGAKSAEKRLGLIPKRIGEVTKKSAEEGERSAAKASKGVLGHFAAMEKASAKLLGRRSLTSGITSGLTEFKSALGEAAGAGSALEGTVGALGIVAGATVGVLAAVAVVGYKIADSWVKSAAAIGRTSDVIGVATKQLQEFQAAGERAGVDKGASTAALGGIAQTLNDARYGRNTDALNLMTRLGVKFKQGADGQLDTSAMTLDLADAIARQPNAQTRRMIAGKFGISDAALPMFLKGSAPLKADMADADRHAAVVDDSGIERGRRIYRKGVIASQMKDRAMMRAGEAAASPVEGFYDGVIAGGHAIMDGGVTFDRSVKNDFVPAARMQERAAASMERSATRIEHSAGDRPGSGIVSQAQRGARLRDKLIASGFSRNEADALAANAVRESGADFRRDEVLPNGKRGPGHGLWQWTDKKRKDNFQRLFGHSIYNSSEDEQISFLKWELSHSEASGWAAAHRQGLDPYSLGRGFALDIERMKDKTGEPVARGDLAQALDKIPVHVTVDVKGGGPGTRATVKAGRSSQPAVSHAFVFDPVHGG